MPRTRSRSSSGDSASKKKKGFRCDICGTTVQRSGDMARHQKLHAANIDDLKYTCTYPGCGHKTLQKSNMKTHEKTHEGIKDRACPEFGCHFATGDSGSLCRHRQRKHGYIPAARNRGGWDSDEEWIPAAQFRPTPSYIIPDKSLPPFNGVTSSRFHGSPAPPKQMYYPTWNPYGYNAGPALNPVTRWSSHSSTGSEGSDDSQSSCDYYDERSSMAYPTQPASTSISRYPSPGIDNSFGAYTQSPSSSSSSSSGSVPANYLQNPGQDYFIDPALSPQAPYRYPPPLPAPVPSTQCTDPNCTYGCYQGSFHGAPSISNYSRSINGSSNAVAGPSSTGSSAEVCMEACCRPTQGYANPYYAYAAYPEAESPQ